MPTDIPLTPEAARVVAAFDAVMDRAGVFEGSNDALAAALRELVAVKGEKTYVGLGVILWADDILAIAANIEQAVTYAPTEPPANEN